MPSEVCRAMNAVGRNAPCPCGSGKRYKECHGAIGTPSAASATVSPGPAGAWWVPQVMREALRAQRSGRLVEAAEKYRRVLTADPSNYDATHMLGLVEYECGRYDIALRLVRRAIELQPNLGTPRHNLRLLESMPSVETEVCREVLPRLARRVDLAVDIAGLAAAAAVHIVIGDAFGEAEQGALSHIVAACGAAQVTIWDEAAGNRPCRTRRVRQSIVGDHPDIARRAILRRRSHASMRAAPAGCASVGARGRCNRSASAPVAHSSPGRS
ncbi:MAG: hypothetical protein E6H78_16015 [Betaproteobacteria bacterium]|nr:MAG: hypothetical protein E6H78_16015 [Betaproteobacteria bacterium]